MKTLTLLCLFVLPGMLATDALAEETRVTVRVLANDAKLIGDVAGGCAITIRDAASGAILASGQQTGGTGDTDRIIREPWQRGDQRFDTEGAAGWTTTLDLDQPTRVLVEARGPQGFANSAYSASRELLLLPGQHVEGNGVVLTLQGLIVNLQEPDPEDGLSSGETITIEAGVKLLCTCPIEADSLWPAVDYKVTAILLENGEPVASTVLEITDRTNTFSGSIEVPVVAEEQTRIFELRINAANEAVGNYGSDATVFRVSG
ncbi:hypothetical protein DRQ53_02350 [bacterium]|nr:MAG: hypothetical protein DRQ53_02350 [bacterium]